MHRLVRLDAVPQNCPPYNGRLKIVPLKRAPIYFLSYISSLVFTQTAPHKKDVIGEVIGRRSGHYVSTKTVAP